MHFGTGMVERTVDGQKHMVRVRVAVKTPARPEDSFIRCTDSHHAERCGSAACSGARFARHKLNCESYGIEVKEISGDIEGFEGLDGVAVATTVATWIAYGADWDDRDLTDTFGWSVCHPASAY